MNKKLRFEPQYFVLLIFFLAGIFLGGLGVFTWIFNSRSLLGLQKIHLSQNKYKFINPLLAVDTGEASGFLQSKTLEGRIENLLARTNRDRSILKFSVYFKDLEAGRWAGVNENLKFSPGRTLKVPIMIAYFKQAQSDPTALTKTIVFKKDPTVPKEAPSDLNVGSPYTVDDLIRSMVIDDDEQATALLFDNIDHDSLDEVYSDLGVDFSEDKTNDDYISTKLNALFFRVLYNATYLNREFSEKALSILSETNRQKGLTKSLPNDLETAHKYRTRSFEKNGQKLTETHDCSIIYYPNHPYVLCAMAIGQKADGIDPTFNDISQIIYKEVRDRYKNN